MIYLDNAASTKPFDDVVSIFTKESLSYYGNSNSNHEIGGLASKHLEEARTKILSLLKMPSSFSLIFNSGASEANNTAIKGIAFSYKNRGNKLLVGATEHPSVLTCFKELQDRFGFDVVILPVNKDGIVEVNTLKENMDDSVILVSIMAVNNETGSINDIKSLSEVVHRFPKAYFHVDATQAIGKLDIDYSNADLISFSGHKIEGLKGTGALIYKKTIRLNPLVLGGEQENGLRSGTVNVPGAVSLAKALERALKEKEGFLNRSEEYKNLIIERLSKTKLVAFNSPACSIPSLLNFSLLKHKASVIVEYLSERGIYVSSFSACSTQLNHYSSVLLAMGKSKADAENAIRVSFGIDTSKEDIMTFLDTIEKAFKEVKTR